MWKTEKFPEDAAIWETTTKHHMSDVESDQEKGLFYRTLPWREDDLNEMIHWCDASMSFIRKYGIGSARPEPPGHN